MAWPGVHLGIGVASLFSRPESSCESPGQWDYSARALHTSSLSATLAATII